MNEFKKNKQTRVNLIISMVNIIVKKQKIRLDQNV